MIMFKLKPLLPTPVFMQLHGTRFMMHHVFVYGTLKRGEPNHYWLESPENGIGKYVSDGFTQTKYPLVIGTRYNIPFLLHSPGKGCNVHGEIYEVDDKMLSKLDILEDHPKYYVREQDDILNSNECCVMKCWVYFLKNFKNEVLEKPHLFTYNSNGPHGLPYMESNNESVIEDLDDDVIADS